MKQKNTASDLLAQIEIDFFEGVNLAAASRLQGGERRTFTLSQVERLLTEENGPDPLAMWLSDMFWTADEGRIVADKSNPLTSQKGQQTLTEDERERLQLILEVAALCHDLSMHYPFDLKETFGIKNEWWVSNKQLVKWLSTTENERIAMHLAYTMKRYAIVKYATTDYLPAQDELADLYSMEHHQLVGNPNETEIPARAYVKIILDSMIQIERHWERGRRMKQDPDVVLLHDEIHGLVPRRFTARVLRAAQALHDYMEKELKGKNITGELMMQFIEKVREVRDKYLHPGWLDDDSLAFGYLVAHAERYGQDLHQEEEKPYDEQ